MTEYVKSCRPLAIRYVSVVRIRQGQRMSQAEACRKQCVVGGRMPLETGFAFGVSCALGLHRAKSAPYGLCCRIFGAVLQRLGHPGALGHATRLEQYNEPVGIFSSETGTSFIDFICRTCAVHKTNRVASRRCILGLWSDLDGVDCVAHVGFVTQSVCKGDHAWQVYGVT